MNLFAAAIVLVGTVAAIIAVAMTVCHAFGLIRGIRGSSEWWVSLIPFIAPALPGALDLAGQKHRSKLVVWGIVAAVLVIGVVIIHTLSSSKMMVLPNPAVERDAPQTSSCPLASRSSPLR